MLTVRLIHKVKDTVGVPLDAKIQPWPRGKGNALLEVLYLEPVFNVEGQEDIVGSAVYDDESFLAPNLACPCARTSRASLGQAPPIQPIRGCRRPLLF